MIRLNLLCVEILCNISLVSTFQEVLKTDIVSSAKDVIVYLICAVASRFISNFVVKKINKKIKNK